MVEEWSDATWGETMTSVETTVDILDNVVMEAYSEGLFTDLYADVSTQWARPSRQ
jgi:hypothetical protein